MEDLLEQCARLGLHPHASDDDELPDPGDYLAWLDDDRATGEFDHGSFATLGLALGDLRAHPSLAELAPNHGVHQAVRAVDRLRAEYGDLTREHPVTRHTREVDGTDLGGTVDVNLNRTQTAPAS